MNGRTPARPRASDGCPVHSSGPTCAYGVKPQAGGTYVFARGELGAFFVWPHIAFGPFLDWTATTAPRHGFPGGGLRMDVMF